MNFSLHMYSLSDIFLIIYEIWKKLSWPEFS